MLPSPKVHLLCEPSDTFDGVLRTASQNTGWALDTFATADEFLRKLRLEHHSCLLISPGPHGPEPAMEMMRSLREKRINIPMLLVASESEPHSLEVAAVHSGAFDVIRVPASPETVKHQVARALEYDLHGAGQPGVVRSRMATLSPKEREVMDLTLLGQNTNAMASTLGVCYQTVNKHRARIRLKMRSKCDITLMNNLLGHPPLPREVGYESTTTATPAPAPVPTMVPAPASPFTSTPSYTSQS